MAYLSTKTYGHEVGLSATFRQWRAKSHCRLLHGYSLSFRFEFEANMLDDKNWVVDFGDLKELRAILEGTFDHKTVVAADDPELEWFREAARRGLADVVVLPAVGCEKSCRTRLPRRQQLPAGKRICSALPAGVSRGEGARREQRHLSGGGPCCRLVKCSRSSRRSLHDRYTVHVRTVAGMLGQVSGCHTKHPWFADPERRVPIGDMMS